MSRRDVMEWIPLVDYASKKGVSLSTLRRYIKAGKLEYKVEDGRYLLPDSPDSDESAPEAGDTTLALQRDLQKAHEEIAELKTLVALYEEKFPSRHRSESN